MTPEQIKKKYEPRILKILANIAKAVEAAGYTAYGPDDMSADEYWWALRVCPHTPKHTDLGDDDVDISFKIAESEQYDGHKGGVNFMLDVVKADGEILGGLTPYNYTPEVWVPRKDKDAVEERFKIMENADPKEIVGLIRE